MRTYEQTIKDGYGNAAIERQHSSPDNPLTAEQKYHIILALIGCTAFIAALFVTGTSALLTAAGLFFMFGVYKVIKNA